MNRIFFLPTAAQLRRFLHHRGIRTKPWHSQPELLESLYRQLADERHADDFWACFRQHTLDLIAELRESRPASELVADMVQRSSLLADEIRAALAQMRGEPGGFRRLNLLLPESAFTLLLGVSLAAVGCGGEVADSAQPAMGGARSSAGGATSAAGGATNRPTFVAGAGGILGCEEAPSIQAMFDACQVDAALTAVYLAELAKCEPSWAEGLAAYFSCANCDRIHSFLEQICMVCPPEGGFTMDMSALSCAQPAYLVTISATSIRSRHRRNPSLFAPCKQVKA